jgi:hypothetical protein
MPRTKYKNMGMRRNIKLVYKELIPVFNNFGSHKRSEIYFYTHWGAEGLEDTLRAALIRGKERWDDESYLARIIFSEMVREDVDGTTGYGIAPYERDDEFPTITVDMLKKSVDGVPFETFITNA